MSTVHRTAAEINHDVAAWPEWTDVHTWELGPDDGPDDDPGLAVESWPEFDSDAPPDGCTDLAGLLAAWASWHRLAGQEDDHAMHMLLADELTAIASNVARGRHRTVAGYLACHHACTVPDLSTLAVPEGRTSPLAGLLDAEARGYLGVGSEPARLCAWLCKGLADDAERWGSETVADYYDDLAAWSEAESEVVEEFCHEYAMAGLVAF